jgi:Xaa-Pro aminopeptidase
MVADRRAARLEALVAALEQEHLDALLLTALPNIRYMTGFSGSAALAVVTRADVLLVTDFRYEEQARAEAGAVARVEVERRSVWERLFRELASRGRSTDTQMIDSTHIKAHRSASGGKGGSRSRRLAAHVAGAIRRSTQSRMLKAVFFPSY